MSNGSKAWTNVVSAWNWNTGQYDYYQLPKTIAPNYGDEVKPPQLGVSMGGLGEDPDQSSRPLPFGARKVGAGSRALGDIVSVNGTSAGMASWIGVALAIVVPLGILLATIHLSDWFGAGSKELPSRNTEDEE
jgi:hypothetical protein